MTVTTTITTSKRQCTKMVCTCPAATWTVINPGDNIYKAHILYESLDIILNFDLAGLLLLCVANHVSWPAWDNIKIQDSTITIDTPDRKIIIEHTTEDFTDIKNAIMSMFVIPGMQSMRGDNSVFMNGNVCHMKNPHFELSISRTRGSEHHNLMFQDMLAGGGCTITILGPIYTLATKIETSILHDDCEVRTTATSFIAIKQGKVSSLDVGSTNMRLFKLLVICLLCGVDYIFV